MKISRLTRRGAGTMGGAAVQEADETFGVRQVDNGVEFKAYFPTAGSVQIAGDFNNWQPQPMQKTGEGLWKVRVPLSGGSYRYRLVVDGQWQNDPYNKMTEPNPFGELNSVVHVS